MALCRSSPTQAVIKHKLASKPRDHSTSRPEDNKCCATGCLQEQPLAMRMHKSSSKREPAGIPARTSSANMSLGCMISRQYILLPSATSMPCIDPAKREEFGLSLLQPLLTKPPQLDIACPASLSMSWDRAASRIGPD